MLVRLEPRGTYGWMFDGISSAAYSYQRYAKALDASRLVLLYADAGVWVAQQGFPTPTRQKSGGFIFCLDFCPFVKTSAETDQNPGMPGSTKSAIEESKYEY